MKEKDNVQSVPSGKTQLPGVPGARPHRVAGFPGGCHGGRGDLSSRSQRQRLEEVSAAR